MSDDRPTGDADAGKGDEWIAETAPSWSNPNPVPAYVRRAWRRSAQREADEAEIGRRLDEIQTRRREDR